MSCVYIKRGGDDHELVSQVMAEKGLKKMKVVVAIDESDGSFYALQWTLDNLYNNLDATATSAVHDDDHGLLTIVHVQQPFQYNMFPVGGPAVSAYCPPSSTVEAIRKSQQENSAAILARAQQMCSAKMVKAKTLILEGEPREMINRTVAQMHADLLVVGSRGLGMIKSVFLGSVSDYCAHHAKCPVLIAKPPSR